MFKRSRAKPLAVLTFSTLTACHRTDPQKPTPAQSTQATVAAASSSTQAAPSATAEPPLPSSPKDPVAARIESRKPVVLDGAAKQTASAYLAALARGRKATVAKQYDLAESQFSACLTLIPDDPRALAERGYARMLADKLTEADADFAAAAKHAPCSIVLQQILHNQMLVARKRGDEPAAKQFEKAKQALKAARRITSGVDCSVNVGRISTRPQRPKDMTEAWQLAVAEHVTQANIKPEEVSLAETTVAANVSDSELWRRISGGSSRDGAWVFTTNGPDSYNIGAHVVFAKGGQLYLYPKVSFAWMGRCGWIGGNVSVNGGGATPWHITISSTENMSGYICEWPDGKFEPCGSRDMEGGNPVQSYCSWSSSTEEVVVYDTQSFEGLVDVTVTAQARSEGLVSEPAHLLELEFQPERFVINACASRREVPYNLEGNQE